VNLQLLRVGVIALWLGVLGAAAAPLEAAAAVAKKSAAAASKKQVSKQHGWLSAKSSVTRAATSSRRSIVRVAHVPARPSFGASYGLHRTEDPLDLASGAAFVVDQESNEILFSKNARAVLPIASLTKLMSALVVVNAQLPLDEVVLITDEDVDTEKGSRSRLNVGTTLTRIDLMHLALMASENRAAHALGRHFPGGISAFVEAMNRQAHELGMRDTKFVEPTGLSSSNQSSARDLAVLVKEAYKHDLIRNLSTSPSHEVAVGMRQLQFRNTNRLVDNPTWQIGLQKTGYISEAGRCLVMQAQLAGRKLIMVLLDSTGKYSRLGDAERIRKWLSEHTPAVSQLSPAQPAI
jgi:serine-type D-Ala-D-Ala endopeptidase (penicillin-binding protein 7)